MYDPPGWLPLPYVIAWLANLGAEGKLPRHLGFVHPGDPVNVLCLSAEATARSVLGELLAGAVIQAAMLVEPENEWLRVLPNYWTSDRAAGTMKTAELDLGFLGVDTDLHKAIAYVDIEHVAEALGLCLIDTTQPEVEAKAAPSTEGEDWAGGNQAAAPTATKGYTPVATADDPENARTPFGWMDFIEALGIYVSGDKDCLTNHKLTQIIEKCGGMRFFLDSVHGRPPLVHGIRLLLRHVCLWRQGKPDRKWKLPIPIRNAIRAAWHAHRRPPFPELCRILLRERAEYRRVERNLETRRAKALASYAARVRQGDLVGLPGVWRNGYGTPSAGLNTHTDVDPRLFANSRRIITADNWLIIGNLALDEEDKEALYDLKIKWEAHARILSSRTHTATKLTHAPTVPVPEGASNRQLEVLTVSDATSLESASAAPATPVPEKPAEPPEFTDPPQQWIPLHVFLAQPALLLAGAPEIHEHPPDAAVLKEVLDEFWRALEAGEIPNRVDFGGAYTQPRAGLVCGQIVGELWRSNSVNRVSGEMEGRTIETCKEPALVHCRTWWRQKQLPAPAPPAPTTDHSGDAPPAVDSEARSIEDWVRSQPVRVRRGSGRQSYSDWEGQRLKAAKSAPLLKDMHITQEKLREADREIRKKKSATVP